MELQNHKTVKEKFVHVKCMTRNPEEFKALMRAMVLIGREREYESH